MKGVFRSRNESKEDRNNIRIKIRASCNRLLCCPSVPDKGVHYACNPMTREFKLLPRSRERPVTRCYPDGKATLVCVSLFDSESNKWRRYVSDQDDHGFTHMNWNQVLFVNGSLLWMTQSFAYILVLDLNLDLWRRTVLPDEMNGSGNMV
ncbi:hypothetical protein L1987_86948 [Smallanthus sonchifolius]|uniref:Uncharacterized protein n=1 Tax=Smallanthus sonchifolius TaxID=185202 RepID=A0ACB8Y1G7_9ASTR|nr:hypothetical protein L1987_86948 [Smallanthus sonchifolius]